MNNWILLLTVSIVSLSSFSFGAEEKPSKPSKELIDNKNVLDEYIYKADKGEILFVPISDIVDITQFIPLQRKIFQDGLKLSVNLKKMSRDQAQKNLQNIQAFSNQVKEQLRQKSREIETEYPSLKPPAPQEASPIDQGPW